jgi:SNF2 family DNA or RNA helicase
MTANDYIGELAVAAELDGVVIIPRVARDSRLVKLHLQRAIPNIRIRTKSHGIFVPTEDSEQLLRMAESIGLRCRAGVERFVINRSRAAAMHSTLREQISAIKSGGVRVARSLLPDLSGIDKLDDHQVVNVAAMTVPHGYGLSVFDEQGAGKTVTLIHAFDLLVQRDEVDIAIIVAPKSMIAEWPRDFARFRGDLYATTMLTGSRSEKERAMSKGGDVYITNFETVVSMEAELHALLRHYQDRAVLVVDESFFIKNPDAKRTQALKRLREWTGRAFVLCGTPAPNSPQDLIEQMNFVDFGIAFESLPRSDNQADAESAIQSALDSKALYVRNLKSVVLPDLPNKEFRRWLVPLQPVQQQIYAAILSELIEELQRTDDTQFKKNIASFLAKRMALLQVCSHPGSVMSGYSEVPAKLIALDELLDNLIGKSGEKVVLWSFFRHSIEKIVQRFERFNPVQYDGSISDVRLRRSAVEAFQNDTKTMLFVGNPAAAGAGLTLHRARFAVYESLSNQPAQYLQSLDRIHRRGQTRQVEYVIMLGKDTIEVRDFERLCDKEKNAQRLLGDISKQPVTRESMLREAEAAAAFLS